MMINITFIIMAVAVLLTGGAAWANMSLLIMVFFILINTASNIRRPLLVGGTLRYHRAQTACFCAVGRKPDDECLYRAGSVPDRLLCGSRGVNLDLPGIRRDPAGAASGVMDTSR